MDENINTEEFDENPFPEQFDSDDVANEPITSQHQPLPADFDIDDVLNYSDEVRRQKHFENIYSGDKDLDGQSIQNILEEDFKDFLQLKKISGRMSGLRTLPRIPKEVLINTQQEIAINDEYSEHDDKPSTVLLHRNYKDEIEYVEVICSCGKRTILRFDYSDSSNDELSDEDATLTTHDYDENDFPSIEEAIDDAPIQEEQFENPLTDFEIEDSPSAEVQETPTNDENIELE